MPLITAEISLAVITVVREDKIVSSVAVVGDAHEAVISGLLTSFSVRQP